MATDAIEAIKNAEKQALQDKKCALTKSDEMIAAQHAKGEKTVQAAIDQANKHVIIEIQTAQEKAEAAYLGIIEEYASSIDVITQKAALNRQKAIDTAIFEFFN